MGCSESHDSNAENNNRQENDGSDSSDSGRRRSTNSHNSLDDIIGSESRRRIERLEARSRGGGKSDNNFRVTPPPSPLQTGGPHHRVAAHRVPPPPFGSSANEMHLLAGGAIRASNPLLASGSDTDSSRKPSTDPSCGSRSVTGSHSASFESDQTPGSPSGATAAFCDVLSTDDGQFSQGSADLPYELPHSED